jgi:hypothetical protein
MFLEISKRRLLAEQEAQGLGSSEVVDGKSRMESFALSVFNSADAEDRSGAPITKLTAARFMVSALWFEVLTQFYDLGELPAEYEDKRRYALFRVKQINQAIRDGVVPESPAALSGESMTAKSQLAPTIPAATSTSRFSYQPEAAEPLVHDPVEVVENTDLPAKQQGPTRSQIISAKKKAQYAASSLEFDDVDAAVGYLQEALRELTDK